MRKLWLTGVAGALWLGLWAPVGAQEAGDVKALFEEKCSICHGIERPTAKRKDRAGWERTVLRMKNVNGAPVTDEQAQAIIDYLTRNYGR
ncbi:MAG: cytochrome c-552 like protein [Deferrisomatales bacterium]